MEIVKKMVLLSQNENVLVLFKMQKRQEIPKMTIYLLYLLK